VYSALYSFENLAPTHEELDARADVSVDTDDCTVVRSEVEGSSLISNLTWVVIDTSGEQVLGRNAMGEYEYTYYRPGEYYVHLEASHEGEYVPISNEVIINCP
jgi:hypothetical protein